jgi:proteasome lid subunit RPN8/RPN11
VNARLAAGAWAAVEREATANYPHEACGVLLGRAGEPLDVLEAHPCPNLNRERSRDRYLIDPREQLRIERDGRERGLDVVGYFHSHPDHPAEPSATDLELSWESLLYLIVSVRDGRLQAGRGWRREPGSRSFAEIALESVPQL